MGRVVERFSAPEGKDEKAACGEIVRCIIMAESPLGIYIYWTHC